MSVIYDRRTPGGVYEREPSPQGQPIDYVPEHKREEFKALNDPMNYIPKSRQVEPDYASTNKINEIAVWMQSLTYGEMIQLSNAIWSKSAGTIDLKELPAILHKWATEHGQDPVVANVAT